MIPRRAWKFVVVAGLLAAALWYGVGLPGAGGRFTNLDTAIAPERAKGWRVVRPPDTAGPYRRDKGVPTLVSPGDMASVTVRTPGGPDTVRLPTRPGAEQLAIPLQTTDGFATVVVLERTPAP